MKKNMIIPESESMANLICDNIPQSITSKDKKLEGAVNLFFLQVPSWCQWQNAHKPKMGGTGNKFEAVHPTKCINPKNPLGTHNNREQLSVNGIPLARTMICNYGRYVDE